MSNPSSLKDTIYKAILQDILSYEYKPNDILNEKALVEKYGCSKSPVREALLELCADNILRSIPRYGYEVIRVTRAGYAAIPVHSGAGPADDPLSGNQRDTDRATG